MIETRKEGAPIKDTRKTQNGQKTPQKVGVKI